MRRSGIIRDRFYRIAHTVKRNRTAVVIYALLSLVFLIIGIAVGVNMSDKTEYVLKNHAPIFSFLRGDCGAVTLFFCDFLLSAVYGIFAASMFFNRVVVFLSLAPCMYKSYVLGMQTCVIVAVFNAPAIPMLFVFFVPACLIDIVIVCMLSFKSFAFCSLNGRCMPSVCDVKQYYRSLIQYAVVIGICSLVKAITAALFGAALIGII